MTEITKADIDAANPFTQLRGIYKWHYYIMAFFMLLSFLIGFIGMGFMMSKYYRKLILTCSCPPNIQEMLHEHD